MTAPLEFVLVWHMHQPDYRLPGSGEFRMPWVYLHALKDYADMAAHLEAAPAMRAVVNFVPVLLDQIEDYAEQFASGRLRDPLLRALGRGEGVPFSEGERAQLLAQCFHADHERLIAPFPAYRRLHELAYAGSADGRDPHGYLSDRYLSDLVTWYHLAWTGETVRRGAPLVAELMARGSGFTEGERRALLELVGRTVATLLPRYRRLDESGRIELTTSPEHHPIGPLLLDFASAREARPDLPLPAHPAYPGGAERLAAQLDAANAAHEARFGRRADGVWPPEGAVSDGFLRALSGRGLHWFASGSQVLDHSLRRAGRTPDAAAFAQPWRFPALAPDLVGFFRDDALSDLIGFEYRRWHGGDAAQHFLAELERRAALAPAGTRPVVTAIVDGENAWEYYPYNGFYFLSELYQRLAQHSGVRTRTPREILAERAAAAVAGRPDGIGSLPGLVAGSWVYGDLTTWIGAPDKNRAWDLLVDAKRACDLALASGRLDAARRGAIARQLAVCESSDWYWWFGDYNPAESVAAFDGLFRTNLERLYTLNDQPPPPALAHPVSVGSTQVQSEGAIRRAH